MWTRARALAALPIVAAALLVGAMARLGDGRAATEAWQLISCREPEAAYGVSGCPGINPASGLADVIVAVLAVLAVAAIVVTVWRAQSTATVVVLATVAAVTFAALAMGAVPAAGVEPCITSTPGGLSGLIGVGDCHPNVAQPGDLIVGSVIGAVMGAGVAAWAALAGRAARR